MEFAKLQQLIRLVGHSRVAEVEIHSGGSHVRILQPANQRAAAQQPAAANPAGAASAPIAAEHVQNSPGVGFFKCSTDIGRQIARGEQLGTIRAMGLENAVLAEQDGFIGDILADDGDAVEYGQPLFVIARE